MKIITRRLLADYWAQHPRAEAGLSRWYKLARAAAWEHLQDVRATFPHADSVRVASGRWVVVFNVSGNKYRLITAIHYNRETVYAMMVLTHAEYDRQKWKDQL